MSLATPYRFSWAPCLHGAMAVICLASLLPSPDARARVEPLLYDLRPFSETAPELVAAFEALGLEGQAEDPAAARASLKERLADRSANGWSDPHTRASARWLEARLILEAGDAPWAVDAGPEDLDAESALSGELRHRRAERAAEGQDTERSARLLLGIPSSVPAHGQAWARGAEQLAALGKPAEAAAGLLQHLHGPISRATERALTTRIARLYARAGDKKAAATLLMRLWWRTSRDQTRVDMERELEALGTPLSQVVRFARPLIDVKASRRTGERKRLTKLRKARASDKGLVDWGLALLARLDPKLRTEAPALMARLERKMRGDVRRPLWHLGSALVLRKVNRDLEAAMHYAALASGWPDHPSADRARVEAAWLLSRKGLPAEAGALWREAAASVGRSDAQRDALWWGGFASVLGGDGPGAIEALTRLRDRYGDERDGVALTWEERATYWLGRTFESMARAPEAARAYATVAVTYPLSWYGQLAQARLERLAPLHSQAYDGLGVGEPSALRVALEAHELPPEYRVLRIPRSPTLDLAVAYLRLGEEKRAIEALDSLVTSGRMNAGGRSLLAVLYDRVGRPDSRDRILRHGTVITTTAVPTQLEMYRHRNPLEFEEILVTECLSRGVSPALFAGLVHVESRFRPHVTSGAGAVGLSQIMPSTARLLGEPLLGRKVSRRALRDPRINLALGSALMGALLEHFRGHPGLALASYNAGRGAVRGWLRDRGHLPTDAFVESIPYGQTRRYVMRVLSMARVYEKLYGLEGEIPPIPDTLPLTLVAFEADTGAR